MSLPDCYHTHRDEDGLLLPGKTISRCEIYKMKRIDGSVFCSVEHNCRKRRHSEEENL